MRALCLDLHQSFDDSVTDNFMGFSSRLKFRTPGLLFADVTESIEKFGDETKFLEELHQFNKDFFPQAQGAIGSTPFMAQLFSRSHKDYFHCTPNEEKQIINEMPLSDLHNLEGLVAWSSQDEVEDIITFFKVLGFNSIGDIQNFDMSSFQQRWGKTGELMWKRLHGFERQIITPLKNNSSHVDHIDLSFPVSLRPYLLHCLEKHCRQLINQVKDSDSEATKLVVYLHCEYNYDVHLIEISPTSDYLNLMYIYEQLEKKLCSIELANPIKKMDIELFTRKPHGKKFFSWHKKWIQDRNQNQMSLGKFDTTTSGHFSPKAYDDFDKDWLQIEGHDETPQSISVGGKQLQLGLTESGSGLKLTSEFLESPEEIFDMNQYQRLSPMEEGLYGLGEDGVQRGRKYFVALDANKEKVCICYDQIEQKYYLKGKLA